MTELFWAAEHEQSVFNIACSRITALTEPGERSQGRDAEYALMWGFTQQGDHLKVVLSKNFIFSVALVAFINN